jgi:thiamine transporter ThiT
MFEIGRIPIWPSAFQFGFTVGETTGLWYQLIWQLHGKNNIIKMLNTEELKL